MSCICFSILDKDFSSSGGLGRRRSKAIFLNINIADIGVTIFPMAGEPVVMKIHFALFFSSRKRDPQKAEGCWEIRYSLCLLFGSKEMWFCHQEIYGTGALLHTMSHWRSGCHFLPFLKQSLPPVLSFAPFLCQVIMYLTAQPLGNREKKQIWTINECHVDT